MTDKKCKNQLDILQRNYISYNQVWSNLFCSINAWEDIIYSLLSIFSRQNVSNNRQILHVFKKIAKFLILTTISAKILSVFRERPFT